MSAAKHTPEKKLHGLAYWESVKTERDHLLAENRALLAALERITEGTMTKPEIQSASIAILRQIVDAWKSGEFGTTEAGILGAPSYVQNAMIVLSELDQ